MDYRQNQEPHRANSNGICSSILIFSCALFVQYLYYATQSTWPIWGWYLYIGYLLIGLAIAKCSTKTIFASKRLTKRRILFGALIIFLFVRAGWTQILGIETDIAHEKKHDQAKGNVEIHTYNEMTLHQLDGFLLEKKDVVVAMGDRAGGLSFWGGDKLKLVQTEGLVMDWAYLKARQLGKGMEYLENKFNIDYFIIDREVVPTYRADGKKIYVVRDPIFGPSESGKLLTYCFPENAVKYHKVYPLWGGPINAHRVVFAFAERVPCS
jgi:hypothetical protein